MHLSRTTIMTMQPMLGWYVGGKEVHMIQVSARDACQKYQHAESNEGRVRTFQHKNLTSANIPIDGPKCNRSQ